MGNNVVEVVDNERLEMFESLKGLVDYKVNAVCRKFGIQNDLGHISKDDLKQSALIAAWNIIPKYDSSKDVKLESFAGHRIYGAILDELRRTTAMHKMPGRRAQLFDIEDNLNIFVTDDLELDNQIDITGALKSKLIDCVKKEIFLAYVEGQSGRDLAKLHGVSHTRISQIVNEVKDILVKLINA